MLKALVQDKIIFVGGGIGCSCCCKRNPPVIHYEGIWVGHVDHPVFCLNACANRKDSLGYIGCFDNKDKGNWLGCSTINSTQLAARIDYFRNEDPTMYLGVDTKK